MAPVLKFTLFFILCVVAVTAGVITWHMWQVGHVGAPTWVWLPWQSEKTSQVAAAPTDFAFPDLANKQRHLSEWRGQTVVLNFWATWCAPCRKEMPLLMDIAKRYAARDVRVVGVAIDSQEAVSGYTKQMGISYPLLIAQMAGMETMSRYGNTRGALPYTVIIDPTGNVVDKQLGAFRPGELEAMLDPLLNRKPTVN